jgi:general stress protein YciG
MTSNASERSRKAAATRKAHDPETFPKMGRLGAQARHSKSPEDESKIAQEAARTREAHHPGAFHEMGAKGGHAVHHATNEEKE